MHTESLYANQVFNINDLCQIFKVNTIIIFLMDTMNYRIDATSYAECIGRSDCWRFIAVIEKDTERRTHFCTVAFCCDAMETGL